MVKLRVSEVGNAFFSLDNLRRNRPSRRTCDIQNDIPESIPGLSSPFNVQFTSFGYNRKVIWSSSGFLRSGTHSFPLTTFVVTGHLRRTCDIQNDIPESIPGLSSPFNVQFTSLGYNKKVIWSSSGFLRSGTHSFPLITFVATDPPDGRVTFKLTFPSRYQVFPVLSTYNLLHLDIIGK